MTIGELFISLGFKIEGDKDLAVVERGLSKATGAATKLLLEVGALNAAFLYMIDTSMKAGMVLRNFGLSTGLSTEELQKWQHAAVVNGMTTEEMAQGIKDLQSARTNFAMGNPQAVGAWAMLGVDPTHGSPFEVLERLRRSVLSFKDVGIARNFLGQIGMENMLPLLRSTNAEWEKWSKNFIVTESQIRKLSALDAAWESLRLSVSSLAKQFSATFAPALTLVAHAFEGLVGRAAGFVRWLQSASPLATSMRLWLVGAALGLLAFGAALSVVVAVMATATVVTGFLASAIGVLIVELLPIIALVAGIGISIGLLVILFQDLWTNVKGGKSAFDWLHSSNLEIWAFAHGLKNILDLWKEIKSIASGGFGGLSGLLPANAIPSGSGRGNTSNHHEQHIQVTVHEAGDAQKTAQAVSDKFDEKLRGTINQSPVSSY